MRLEAAVMTRIPGAVPCALLLVLTSGCSLLDVQTGSAHPASNGPAPIQVSAISAHLDALQHLIQAPATDQPQILAAAQKDYESNPSPDHQLRYALMLAMPGHAGENPGKAEQLLTTLPDESLNPNERALVLVELQNVRRALAVNADNQRLIQALADRSERDRPVANSRRLQQELDENAKLRKELEDVRAKLDAIAEIERRASRPAP